MRYAKRIARKYDIKEFNNSGTPCGVIVKEGDAVAIFRGPRDADSWIAENYSPFRWGIIALPRDETERKKTIDDIALGEEDVFVAKADSTIVPVTDGLFIYASCPVLSPDNRPAGSDFWQKRYGDYKFHSSEDDWKKKEEKHLPQYLGQSNISSSAEMQAIPYADHILVQKGAAKFFKGKPVKADNWYSIPRGASTVRFPDYHGKKNCGRPDFK